MRKELILLLVLLGVFFAIGCVGDKGEAPNATVTSTVASPSYNSFCSR